MFVLLLALAQELRADERLAFAVWRPGDDVSRELRELRRSGVDAALVAGAPASLRTRKGRLLAMPYPQEVNDIPMIALHHGTAEAFADMIIANHDEMLRQSHRQPLVYGIALHAFIMGQPFRIKALRRAFEHITRPNETTWFATTGAIADHFVAHGPQFS